MRSQVKGQKAKAKRQNRRPEREKVLDEALKTARDKELARKLAELALDGLDRFLHRK